MKGIMQDHLRCKKKKGVPDRRTIFHRMGIVEVEVRDIWEDCIVVGGKILPIICCHKTYNVRKRENKMG